MRQGILFEIQENIPLIVIIIMQQLIGNSIPIETPKDLSIGRADIISTPTCDQVPIERGRLHAHGWSIQLSSGVIFGHGRKQRNTMLEPAIFHPVHNA